MLLQRHVNLIDRSNRLHFNDPKVLQTVVFYARLVAGRRAIARMSRRGLDGREILPGGTCGRLHAGLEGGLPPRIRARAVGQGGDDAAAPVRRGGCADEHGGRNDGRHLPLVPASRSGVEIVGVFVPGSGGKPRPAGGGRQRAARRSPNIGPTPRITRATHFRGRAKDRRSVRHPCGANPRTICDAVFLPGGACPGGGDAPGQQYVAADRRMGELERAFAGWLAEAQEDVQRRIDFGNLEP